MKPGLIRFVCWLGLSLSGGSVFAQPVGDAQAEALASARLRIVEIRSAAGAVIPKPPALELTGSVSNLGLSPIREGDVVGFTARHHGLITGTPAGPGLFEADVAFDLFSEGRAVARSLGRLDTQWITQAGLGAANTGAQHVTLILELDWRWTLAAHAQDPLLQAAWSAVALHYILPPEWNPTLVSCPGGNLTGGLLQLAASRVDSPGGSAGVPATLCMLSVTVPALSPHRDSDLYMGAEAFAEQRAQPVPTLATWWLLLLLALVLAAGWLRSRDAGGGHGSWA